LTQTPFWRHETWLSEITFSAQKHRSNGQQKGTALTEGKNKAGTQLVVGVFDLQSRPGTMRSKMKQLQRMILLLKR
jgi:hypothetical protein